MTHRFNGELFKYSKDAKLLERIDESWEANRSTGAPFLHELPPNVLESMIQVYAELVARTVPRSEYNEYTRLSLDTTRRLGIALDVIRDLAYSNKPISRSALRGWFLSLSVPSDTDKNDMHVDKAPEVEDDYLNCASNCFEEFKQRIRPGDELKQQPPHVGVAALSDGLVSLGAALNAVLQYLIEGDNDCRKAMKESKVDVGHMVMVEIGPEGASKVKAPPGPGERHERQELWRDAVQSKLENLANSHDKVGSMNRSEILALSACLDVAIRARNDQRK